MIRQPAPTGNDKNNVEVRMICTSISIASNFKDAKPAKQT